LTTPNDILTLTELADYLKIAERTVYGWAQDGKLPAYKMAGNWRFRRRDIDAWLETQRTGPILDNSQGSFGVATPPIGPTEEKVQRLKEYEASVLDSISAIEADLGDRSRNVWAISRYNQFDEEVLNDAIRRLKRRKKIKTGKTDEEITIIRS
jgi:excisionase family DNA binding protein